MSAIEPVKPRDPRVPLPSGMATRVAIISAIAMALFAVIFFRLWYLQVLSGEQYVKQANANRARDLPIPAPRGEMLDSEGKVLVSRRTTNAVQIVPTALPDSEAVAKQATAYQKSLDVSFAVHRAAQRAFATYRTTHAGRKLTHAERSQLAQLRVAARRPVDAPVPSLAPHAVRVRKLFARLGAVLGMRGRTIDERVVRGMTELFYAPVTIKTDAGAGVLTFLGERGGEFPGVVQRPVSIRDYPHGEMAAQIFGHVGSVSEEELKQKAFKEVQPGTIVGQEGLEYYYDRYLRGTAGTSRIEVNAEGYAVPSNLKPTPPEAGRSLKLTLDLGLQQESEKALLQGIERARAGGKPAVAGAFVAIDPRNGKVLSIGSYPSFDPNVFAKPLTPSEYESLAGEDGSSVGRLTDRAVNGQYPTGSTFKPITALAALEAGVISPDQGLGAGQCIYVSTEKFCNAGNAEYGAVGLVEALKVSSDTYFFEVGERANEHGPVIQEKARQLGIGEKTGIDLPSEFEGVVPDKRWRERENRLELACERKRHLSNCGIVLEPTGTWTVGNNMDLAVGQGELLTDPLQMAVAYSTLANAYTHGGEGWVVRPHLGQAIDEPTGGLVQGLNYPPRRRVHLNYSDLSLVMQGIHDAASQTGGTSAEVWAGWNQSEHPVFGKTGTAQHYLHVDQSWYLCYIADPQRPIVIAVTVEEGGFGAETAAPIARLMAAKWFGKQEKFVAGSSKTL